MDWREEYKKKLVSPEDAIKAVKSGDNIFLSQPEPLALGLALASRAGELNGVKIVGGGGRDLPFYDSSWYEAFPDTFQLQTSYVLPMIRGLVTERRADFALSGLYGVPEVAPEKSLDVFIVQIAPPDEHGFCSFGASLWLKKD